MEVDIRVAYKGFDEKIDAKIISVLESIDAKWYAQGFSRIDNRRDICFDLEVT